MASVFVVHARTSQSSASVGTADATAALKSARDMEGPDSDITIVGPDGIAHTVAAFAAIVSAEALAAAEALAVEALAVDGRI